jgi:hypothetical protein
VASANPRTRGRRRRVRRGGSRNRFDGDRGRRNPERAGAADAHPKLPAYAYREHANTDDGRVNTDYGRVNTDYGRVNTDYGRVNIAVESIRRSLHDANRDGSSTTARVGNRKWPAADLAARPDRPLCPDRGRGLLLLPRSGDRRDPTHWTNVVSERERAPKPFADREVGREP